MHEAKDCTLKLGVEEFCTLAWGQDCTVNLGARELCTLARGEDDTENLGADLVAIEIIENTIYSFVASGKILSI